MKKGYIHMPSLVNKWNKGKKNNCLAKFVGKRKNNTLQISNRLMTLVNTVLKVKLIMKINCFVKFAI